MGVGAAHGQGAGLAGGGKGGGTGAHGGGAGYSSTTSNTGKRSFSYGVPTGLFSSTYSRNRAEADAQARASAENANRGGAPNWLTSGQIRLDQDVGPVRAPLDGTGLSSDSVAQPLDAIAEAEARADARRRAGGREQLTSGGDVGFEREDEELGVT